MKVRILFFWALVAIPMAIKMSIMSFLFSVLFACNNPVDNDPDIENPEPLQSGEVRFKTYPNEDKEISLIVVSKSIRIDWGDGTTEEFTPNGASEMFAHTYRDHNPKIITLHTEEMKAFGAFSMVRMNGVYVQTSGYLEEIHFEKCTHLEEVILRGNALNRIEMEETNALHLLDCSYNSLSAATLNGLFSSLPESKDGILIFRENEGSAASDISIALSKGWTVQLSLPDEEIITQEIDNETLIQYTNAVLSDFENFLKPVYLYDALYTHSLKLDDYPGFSEYSDIFHNLVSSTSSNISKIWSLSYTSIHHLNVSLSYMLKRAGNVTFSNYIHTVKVLRCYAYFILLNYWGDVVYIDEKTMDDVLSDGYRMDKDQLFTLLIEQLLEAESALPATETDHILSKDYARLMLSKIYTYQGDYTKALEYAEKIITSEQYHISADYADIFQSADNSEHLTQYRSVYRAPNSWEDLIKKGKHAPFSRYTEVILLAAENYLKSGNIQTAVNFLNQIRNRNNRATATANLSIPDIEDMILEEYLLDLGNEGLYFFALKRFGKAEQTLGIESFRLLFPIPLAEIYTNPNITQNVGYEF